MQQYKDLLQDILDNGVEHSDRTGVGTKRLFVRTARFNLQDGFPIVTLKKTYFLGALRELLFFLSGGHLIKDMHESIQKWWRPFSDECGYLGKGTYGLSLRQFPHVDGRYVFDQVNFIIEQIIANPNSRRVILTSYNPSGSSYDLDMNEDEDTNYLVPCHLNMVQFQVQDGRLNLAVTCRSQDTYLGTPVNWAEHALLCHIIANICDLEVGEYVWVGNDVHLYSNHTEQCHEVLKRSPLPLPQLVIKRKLTSVDDLREEDFELVNYQHHPAIKGEMAI